MRDFTGKNLLNPNRGGKVKFPLNLLLEVSKNVGSGNLLQMCLCDGWVGEYKFYS